MAGNHEFSVVLSGAILISAVTSLTLAPMLCAVLVKAGKQKNRRRRFLPVVSRKAGPISALYARTLRWVIGHPSLMLAVTLGTICLTIWLYRIVSKGFFPQQDTGIIMAITEGAQDASFDAIADKQAKGLQIVTHDSSVASVVGSVGSSPSTTSNQGRLFITLVPRSQRRENATEIAARLRTETSRVPGIRCFFQAFQDIRVGGRPNKGQYIYSLTSTNEAELNAYVPKLMEELGKHKDLKDLTTDQQQSGLQSMVTVDRAKAAELGIEAQQVDSRFF